MALLNRPRIGLNLDYVAAGKSTRAHYRLNQGYAEAIYQAGGLPVLMPLIGNETEINQFLEQVDGFVLTAGLDLDPRRQGQAKHPACTLMPEKREDHDRMVVRQLIQRALPTVAIDTGMLLVNVLCGGTLIQHLPEECPKAMPHVDTGSTGPHRHMVHVVPGTQLEAIYGCLELRVNSSHHQAIKTLSPRFRVCATAPDQVVEAIESIDERWFCIGVQWQPQSETASALDQQLFEALTERAKGQTLSARAA